MIKTATKITVKDQDKFRRASIRQMSPSKRLSTLIRARDLAFPYESIKKVVTRRKLA